MRTSSKLVLLAVAAVAGFASAAQAAPLPLASVQLEQPALVEKAQFYSREGYQRYRYRKQVRREWARERRYDAHLRRQEHNYRRRAYRYGY
ncbi:hypothetical protein ACYQR9_07105 [Methylobacterium sp. CM6241]